MQSFNNNNNNHNNNFIRQGNTVTITELSGNTHSLNQLSHG